MRSNFRWKRLVINDVASLRLNRPSANDVHIVIIIDPLNYSFMYSSLSTTVIKTLTPPIKGAVTSFIVCTQIPFFELQMTSQNFMLKFESFFENRELDVR